MPQNNLAGYFTDSDKINETSGDGDIGGRTFFDVIAECKDFNEKDLNNDPLADAIYDIWPMSQDVHALIGTAVQFNRQFLFAFQEPLTDTVKQLVVKYYGETEAIKRVLPNSESVIADLNGLQILINCGCIRSAVNLTSKILKSLEMDETKSIFTPYSLQVWFLRIAFLMKLRLFKEAESELTQFGSFFNMPEFFYEFHASVYPGRKGSMIPFGLRILAAELPQFLGKTEESITNLYHLLSVVQSVLDENKANDNEFKVWYNRKTKVLFSIVNILNTQKNYDKVIEVLEQILDTPFIDQCSVWSSIGKLFVQMGNLKDASDCFVKAKKISNPESVADKSRILIDMSLIRIANGMYKEAYDALSEANSMVQNNPIIINNMAFCLFYSGKLKEAITLIEKFVANNPNKNINESLIFNLCTLYELESAKAQQKKLKLLLWLNIYAGDGFSEGCLQL